MQNKKDSRISLSLCTKKVVDCGLKILSNCKKNRSFQNLNKNSEMQGSQIKHYTWDIFALVALQIRDEAQKLFDLSTINSHDFSLKNFTIYTFWKKLRNWKFQKF